LASSSPSILQSLLHLSPPGSINSMLVVSFRRFTLFIEPELLPCCYSVRRSLLMDETDGAVVRSQRLLDESITNLHENIPLFSRRYSSIRFSISGVATLAWSSDHTGRIDPFPKKFYIILYTTFTTILDAGLSIENIILSQMLLNVMQIFVFCQ